jgi:hypothetical protein
MNATNPTMDRLFDGGPPLKIERRLRLVKPDDPGIARRVCLVALTGWVPLLVLTTVQDVLLHNGSVRSFMLDFGAHGRFLFAAPLMILAEFSCLPILGRITRHFIDSGIVRDRDGDHFEATLTATRRLLNSTLVEIIVVIAAFGTAAALRASSYIAELPQWNVSQESYGRVLSVAGMWQTWVSLPLLLILFFGWLWRQFLWCRLMWQIARFDLKVVAGHPDRAGGLKFLGIALRGYFPLVFALSMIVAGGIANHIWGGASIYDFRFSIGGLVLFILALFVAPFGVFVPALRRLRERGIIEYGGLSCAVGHQFEAKWLKHGVGDIKAEALEAPDFSATTDLYQISSNVYQIRYIPLDWRDVVGLIVIALIPFVPVLLLSVPLQVVLRALKEILL